MIVDYDGVVRFISQYVDEGPVLELGVGTGQAARRLSTQGVDVTGIDISRAMIDQLHRNAPRVRGIVADMRSTGLPGATYQVVYACWATFNFLTDARDQFDCVEECSRLLAKGGYLVLDYVWPPPAPGYSNWIVEQNEEVFRQLAQDYDSDTQLLSATHVEMRNERQPRTIPMSLRVTTPLELYSMARFADLTPIQQNISWSANMKRRLRVSVFRKETEKISE